MSMKHKTFLLEKAILGIVGGALGAESIQSLQQLQAEFDKVDKQIQDWAGSERSGGVTHTIKTVQPITLKGNTIGYSVTIGN